MVRCLCSQDTMETPSGLAAVKGSPSSCGKWNKITRSAGGRGGANPGVLRSHPLNSSQSRSGIGGRVSTAHPATIDSTTGSSHRRIEVRRLAASVPVDSSTHFHPTICESSSRCLNDREKPRRLAGANVMEDEQPFENA